MNWKPIETAPLGGVKILTCRDGAGFAESVRACWWVVDFEQGTGYWQDDADSEPAPTHWDFLPMAPTVAADHKRIADRGVQGF